MKKAFTLIELLVVIAVIAILASLFLPVFSSAKNKANTAYCINNLRQIGISISTYVSDNGVYPPLVTFEDHAPKQPWTKTLKTDKLFCPDFKKMYKGHETIYGENSSGYGYNSSGCWGWSETGRQLGLDMMFLPSPYLYPAGITDVVLTRDAMIKVPSDMISNGDGIIHYRDDNDYYSTFDLSSGLWWVRYYLSSSSESPSYELNAKRAILTRHRGKENLVFCDGHVETLGLMYVFNTTNEFTLKRWNNDNLPHFEAFYPSLRLP